jgi:hypothetical protein
VLIFCFKGTVSQDFMLQVFLMNPLFQAPENKIRVISNFFKKFCSGIFASQGTPLVSTTQMGNLQPVSSTPVANSHRYQQHRGKFAEEGGPQLSSGNLQICGLTKFVKFANLPQVWHLWICELQTQYFLRFGLQIFMQI